MSEIYRISQMKAMGLMTRDLSKKLIAFEGRPLLSTYEDLFKYFDSYMENIERIKKSILDDLQSENETKENENE